MCAPPARQLLFFATWLVCLGTALAGSGTAVLEDFASGPLSWTPRSPLPKDHPPYTIVEENQSRYLRAAPAVGTPGIIIYKEIPMDLKKTPLLRWKWRALKLPKGADEKVRERNDSAAAVYVMFQKGPLRRLVKYVWSTTQPAGSVFEALSSRWYVRTRLKVLRSGVPSEAWVEETVDLQKDYAEIYGDDRPGRAYGIGLMSDNDATRSEVRADYDDFLLLPRPATD